MLKGVVSLLLSCACFYAAGAYSEYRVGFMVAGAFSFLVTIEQIGKEESK